MKERSSNSKIVVSPAAVLQTTDDQGGSMGLKSCKECKNQVAEHAIICVHCGLALPGIGDKKKEDNKPGTGVTTLAIVLLILMIYLFRRIMA